MVTIHELIGDPAAFIHSVSDGLTKIGIDRAELALMDHICYRVETRARYLELRDALGSLATLLGESIVANRPIAIYEFTDYPSADGWVVPYLELPAPKEGFFFPEGLEHAELVVVGALDRFAHRHADLPFDTRGMDKLLNPELSYRTSDLAVKFHEQPLGAVVRAEQRLQRIRSLS